MDDGQDKNAGGRYFVENDVRGMLVTAYTTPDHFCFAAHTRIVGQQLEYLLQFNSVGFLTPNCS